MLRDAGAIPFVKTNIPITLLSYESASDIFGRATNPYSKGYAPGGSSGGEAALLALGGSRIGIGTDVAGSVRIPAHYSGIYTIRASAFRFPKTGNMTSMPGQEGVPAVCSPMAKTLEDLETFWKAVFLMKPWTYDHSVNCHRFRANKFISSYFEKLLRRFWKSPGVQSTCLRLKSNSVSCGVTVCATFFGQRKRVYMQNAKSKP